MKLIQVMLPATLLVEVALAENETEGLTLKQVHLKAIDVAKEQVRERGDYDDGVAQIAIPDWDTTYIEIVRADPGRAFTILDE